MFGYRSLGTAFNRTIKNQYIKLNQTNIKAICFFYIISFKIERRYIVPTQIVAQPCMIKLYQAYNIDIIQAICKFVLKKTCINYLLFYNFHQKRKTIHYSNSIFLWERHFPFEALSFRTKSNVNTIANQKTSWTYWTKFSNQIFLSPHHVCY